MAKEHTGSRILVIVSSAFGAAEPAANGGAEGSHGSDAERSEATDASRESEDASDGCSTDPSAEGGGGDDVGAHAIIAALDRELPGTLLSRREETAVEYVAELGPTLDCVVLLGAEPTLIRDFITNGSVSIVVYDPPAVSVVNGTAATGTLEELVGRVRDEIETNRAESNLREANARLTALSHYAEDITACETVEAVLDRTIDATVEALAFDYTVVLLAQGELLVPRVSTLPDPPASPSGIFEGIAGRTLAAGESEIVDDMQTDPDAIPEHDELYAVLSVPIGDHGVVQIASKERGAFDERDREFVDILAGYTKEALDRVEREVTLREERDRLHAFFGDHPVPAVFVEQRDDAIEIEERNCAYAGQFGDPRPGQSLSSAGATPTELERYRTALRTGETAAGTVERSTTDGSTRTFDLSVVPVSPPGVDRCAYGIYVGGDGDPPEGRR
ncbi:GAF domain-containing protein [Halobellus sp. Atlit-31R]|nr:GAF domain-containing protein [Halobellus sp. Atlit-31R]